MEVADSARPLSPSKGDRDLEKDMAISTEKPYSSPIPPDSSAKGIYIHAFFLPNRTTNLDSVLNERRAHAY